jgi:hypothetical protein
VRQRETHERKSDSAFDTCVNGKDCIIFMLLICIISVTLKEILPIFQTFIFPNTPSYCHMMF